MARFKYKGITFAEGWTGTLEQFKAEFENTHPFRSLEPKLRGNELKRVFNELIAFGDKKKPEEAKQ